MAHTLILLLVLLLFGFGRSVAQSPLIYPPAPPQAASSNDYTTEIPFVDLPNDITKVLRSDDYKGWLRTNAWFVKVAGDVHYKVRMIQGNEEKKLWLNPDGSLRDVAIQVRDEKTDSRYRRDR